MQGGHSRRENSFCKSLRCRWTGQSRALAVECFYLEVTWVTFVHILLTKGSHIAVPNVGSAQEEIRQHRQPPLMSTTEPLAWCSSVAWSQAASTSVLWGYRGL